MTSRRRLTALADDATVSLDVLSAGQAAELLAAIAARPGLRRGTGRSRRSRRCASSGR
ncbi:MAG TPA: hypothetical protein VGH88_24000 [Streptosporangiaceae bacterium]